MPILVPIDLTQQSATVIILCAFGVHNLKEVSRVQLQSACRFFNRDQKERKLITKAEKSELLIPLARHFIREGIVVVQGGVDISHLNRNNVTKEKTF